MKVVNGKIAEATRLEMFDYYLTREYDYVMSFPDFLHRCEEAGTKITAKEEQ